MLETRLHGRGGQGAVTAATILADAVVREGKYGQAIPFYRLERRGAPTVAYVRIDERPIRIATPITQPDCSLVLDSKLPELVDVASGLKEDGILILNCSSPPERVDSKVGLSKLVTVDATRLAELIFGPSPIPITNTLMLGAFAVGTGWVKLDSLLTSIAETFNGQLAEKNSEACKTGYNNAMIATVHAATHEWSAIQEAAAESVRWTGTFIESHKVAQIPSGTWRTYKPVIEKTKCTKCGLCDTFCPDSSVIRSPDGFEINYEFCKGCGICLEVCKLGAIAMVREVES